MSKRICKRILMIVLFTLFLFLVSCACVSDKPSVTYEFDRDTRDLVEEAIADAKAERNIINAIAQAADQSSVFDNDGTTGWEAFIDEVDDSIDNFEYALEDEYVFGAYSEDMEVSGSTGVCLYHHDPCQHYYLVNLDYPGLIDPNCIVHEGVHGEPDYPSHSDTLYDLLAAYGEYLPVASEIWEQVIDDQDTPYDSSFFVWVADDIYMSYEMECNVAIDFYSEIVVSGALSVEEAKSAIHDDGYSTTIDDIYYSISNDIFNCEWWMSYDELSTIEANHNPGLVAFDISDEELIAAFCDNISPTCEERFDAHLDALSETMATIEEMAEETATEATARTTEITSTIANTTRNVTKMNASSFRI